jgi:hypothetical protein
MERNIYVLERPFMVPYSLLLISNKIWMGGGGSRWRRSEEGAELEVENKRGGAGRLSYFMHLSGPSRVIKLLNAPVPPPSTVWALKPPSWALHLLGLSLAICVCTRR